MKKVISGIQQIGIGIPDVEEAWAWYRKYFGTDIPVFREAAEAPFMTRYTGGKVQSRDACLAINLNGGGGFEIWQYTSRVPQTPSFEPQLGDYGIFIARVKNYDVQATFTRFKREGLDVLGELTIDPAGSAHFFVRDPYGNIFQVVEGEGWFTKGKHDSGGPAGAMIGVSDIDKSLKLYRDVLDYETVVYDETGVFDDLKAIPGGSTKVRRVLLAHAKPRKGAFSKLLGPTRIELVQALDGGPYRNIFEGRYWGDQGFIHLCFDIRGMGALKDELEKAGYPFTVDSESSFDMGEAAGHFTYIEDNDGTWIEFVETHKLPIIKKLGWYKNLKKADPEKPLPDWMLKALSLGRVKG